MLGPDSNVSPRNRRFACATESAGSALRAGLLKASPEGEGFHPSQRETLRPFPGNRPSNQVGRRGPINERTFMNRRLGAAIVLSAWLLSPLPYTAAQSRVT